MKAAIVQTAGQTPIYAEFADPVASAGEICISVNAAAISHVTRSRAAATHYSAATSNFPFIAGVDGVGQMEDGQRVYFALPQAPYGGMAERTLVSPAHCVAIPDGLDDTTAAAIANPGMSSWVAFSERARIKAGETVLINGATGTAGRLAIQIARHLGAAKVIATGRDTEALTSLAAIGADIVVPLAVDDMALEADFKRHFADGIDVVIDYLWGRSAERLLIAAAKAAPDAVPIRFVQVGSIAGSDITFPAAVLRSSAIEMTGSGIGSVGMKRMVAVIGDLFQATVTAGFDIATYTVPLSDVEQAWARDDSKRRTVFTMGR